MKTAQEMRDLTSSATGGGYSAQEILDKVSTALRFAAEQHAAFKESGMGSPTTSVRVALQGTIEPNPLPSEQALDEARAVLEDLGYRVIDCNPNAGTRSRAVAGWQISWA